jgi:hypothetical protein
MLGCTWCLFDPFVKAFGDCEESSAVTWVLLISASLLLMRYCRILFFLLFMPLLWCCIPARMFGCCWEAPFDDVVMIACEPVS